MKTAVLRCAATVTLCAVTLGGCSDGTPSEPGGPGIDELELRAVEVASGFSRPVYLTSTASDPRLFVVEQAGRIHIIADGERLSTPFIDISHRVADAGEQGLLGMAFHPQYATNRQVYLSFTALDGATHIERFAATASGDALDPASASLVLRVPQPVGNHNGGLIKFAPDGMLWIGLGDGGGGGDPFEHGQDRDTLLGSMLRIDVDGGSPYAVPPGNPFAGGAGGRPEIWAIGLRNPWRWSFDREGGTVYIADVGQGRREEVNAQPITAGGLNYGWNIMEGTLCFAPQSGCNQSGLVLPVAEYTTGSGGCAVTGGYVYRGQAIPGLRGHYLYGDFCQGWVRSFRLTPGGLTDEKLWPLGNVGHISSFGEDAAGELYIVAHDTGRILRIEQDD